MNYNTSLILREIDPLNLKIKLRAKHTVKNTIKSINYLRFIDSYGLISGLLEDLENHLISNGNEPIYTQQMLKDVAAPCFTSIDQGKAGFCYDYVHGFNGTTF